MLPAIFMTNKKQTRTNHRKVKSSDLYRLAPQTGLEPVTPRLTAACSTDWAIKAFFKELYHLSYPKVVLCRHRLIFPGRFQPSIVSTDELNYRVRDGNGWTLIAKNTDYLNYSSRFLFSMTLSYHGDPYEIRTRVAGVRGRSLRPLDQRAIFMVHHHGLEPWTPWLRVRCSTNWANGA